MMRSAGEVMKTNGKGQREKGRDNEPEDKGNAKKGSIAVEEERARAEEAKDRRKPKVGPKEAEQLLFLWRNEPQGP